MHIHIQIHFHNYIKVQYTSTHLQGQLVYGAVYAVEAVVSVHSLLDSDAFHPCHSVTQRVRGNLNRRVVLLGWIFRGILVCVVLLGGIYQGMLLCMVLLAWIYRGILVCVVLLGCIYQGILVCEVLLGWIYRGILVCVVLLKGIYRCMWYVWSGYIEDF